MTVCNEETTRWADIRVIDHHWDNVKRHIQGFIELSECSEGNSLTLVTGGKKEPFETSSAPCGIHDSGCFVGTKGPDSLLCTSIYCSGLWEGTTHPPLAKQSSHRCLRWQWICCKNFADNAEKTCSHILKTMLTSVCVCVCVLDIAPVYKASKKCSGKKNNLI